MQLMLYTAISDWSQSCLWFTLFKQWTLQRLGSVRGGERACWKKKTVAENVFCLCKDHIPYNQEKGHWKGICAYPETQPYFFISYARHYIRCDLLTIFIIKATRAALAAEESKIERLKAQLKELLRFSQDVQPHADSVVSAIQQYQRYWEVLIMVVGRWGKSSLRGCQEPKKKVICHPIVGDG